jgi:hypothetical protein
MTIASHNQCGEAKATTALNDASASANLNDSFTGITFYFCGRHATPRQTAQFELKVNLELKPGFTGRICKCSDSTVVRKPTTIEDNLSNASLDGSLSDKLTNLTRCVLISADTAGTSNLRLDSTG